MFLGFDTTTDSFSVALGGNKKILGEINISGRRHSEKLIPAVDRLLKKTGIGREEIKALGMGTGPGSFTGIRVGLSFGITFAQIMKIAAYGFSSLDLAGRKNSKVLLKAYSDRYYHGRYNEDGQRRAPFTIISSAEAEKMKAKKIEISGVEIVRETRRLYNNKASGDWRKIKPIYLMQTVYRKKSERT